VKHFTIKLCSRASRTESEQLDSNQYLFTTIAVTREISENFRKIALNCEKKTYAKIFRNIVQEKRISNTGNCFRNCSVFQVRHGTPSAYGKYHIKSTEIPHGTHAEISQSHTQWSSEGVGRRGGRPERHLSKGWHIDVSKNWGFIIQCTTVQKRYKEIIHAYFFTLSQLKIESCSIQSVL